MSEIYKQFEMELSKLCDVIDWDYDAAVAFTHYIPEDKLAELIDEIKWERESYES
jgi:hypothetical protein